MAARARLEKAALVLGIAALEEVGKLASKRLSEQANELNRDDDALVLVDLSASGVPRFDWPAYGDIVDVSRERAAEGALEQLRDNVLEYAEWDIEGEYGDTQYNDAEHVVRANDGRSKPLRYSRTFGPSEFIDLASRLAAQLNQPYLARVDRPDGEPLLAATELDEEKRRKLEGFFARWKANNRAEDVTRDDLAKLLRGALRALGATKDAAKHLFEAEDVREMRRAERARS
jgi:hypothetical protein